MDATDLQAEFDSRNEDDRFTCSISQRPNSVFVTLTFEGDSEIIVTGGPLKITQNFADSLGLSAPEAYEYLMNEAMYEIEYESEHPETYFTGSTVTLAPGYVPWVPFGG